MLAVRSPPPPPPPHPPKWRDSVHRLIIVAISCADETSSNQDRAVLTCRNTSYITILMHRRDSDSGARGSECTIAITARLTRRRTKSGLKVAGKEQNGILGGWYGRLTGHCPMIPSRNSRSCSWVQASAICCTAAQMLTSYSRGKL